jgi:hypothetical protein
LVIPTKGTATELYVQANSFASDAITATLYWQLRSTEGLSLLDGNYTMTPEQFASWGEDNSYLNTIVADAIGVEIIPTEESIEE